MLANKLYGLTFTPAPEIEVYHPEAMAYEVKDESGKVLAVLYMDFFPRESKRQGAWMTEFRGTSIVDGVERRPLAENAREAVGLDGGGVGQRRTHTEEQTRDGQERDGQHKGPPDPLQHAEGRRLPLDLPPRPLFFCFFCSIHKNLLVLFLKICDEDDKSEFI